MCRECDEIARKAFRSATGRGGPVITPADATYALLTDGSTVEVRPARRQDHEAVRPVDTAALADALPRVSRLADDLPEVSELALNPIVAREDGAWCVDVRVRISPAEPKDPFLRRLL